MRLFVSSKLLTYLSTKNVNLSKIWLFLASSVEENDEKRIPATDIYIFILVA